MTMFQKLLEAVDADAAMDSPTVAAVNSGNFKVAVAVQATSKAEAHALAEQLQRAAVSVLEAPDEPDDADPASGD